MIDHENNNRGLTDTRDALQLAESVGLDLVVVSESKDAPVAKILNYGKHQYQQKKRQRQSAKPTMKEVNSVQTLASLITAYASLELLSGWIKVIQLNFRYVYGAGNTNIAIAPQIC